MLEFLASQSCQQILCYIAQCEKRERGFRFVESRHCPAAVFSYSQYHMFKFGFSGISGRRLLPNQQGLLVRLRKLYFNNVMHATPNSRCLHLNTLTDFTVLKNSQKMRMSNA